MPKLSAKEVLPKILHKIHHRYCYTFFSKLLRCPQDPQDPQPNHKIRNYDGQCEAVESIVATLQIKIKKIELKVLYHLSNLNDSERKNRQKVERAQIDNKKRYSLTPKSLTTRLPQNFNSKGAVDDAVIKGNDRLSTSSSDQPTDISETFSEIMIRVKLINKNLGKKGQQDLINPEGSQNWENLKRGKAILQKIESIESELSEFLNPCKDDGKKSVGRVCCRKIKEQYDNMKKKQKIVRKNIARNRTSDFIQC